LRRAWCKGGEQTFHHGELIMKPWQAIVRLASRAYAPSEPTTVVDSHLIELTAAQLEQVAGGGGKLGIAGRGADLYGGALGGVIGS
jgi:hypothetical protein